MSDETLLRIEYKLDLLIRALQHKGVMLLELPSLHEMEGDQCPLCERPIRLSVDYETETLSRSCGCKPGVRVVKGISNLTKTHEDPDNGDRSRPGEGTVPPLEEEAGSSGG